MELGPQKCDGLVKMLRHALHHLLQIAQGQPESVPGRLIKERNLVVAARTHSFGAAEDVGKVDNAGLSLIFAGLRWLVMKAHHGEDLGRKVPLSHQQAAGLVMGEVQDFLLRLPQQYVIAQRETAGLPEGIAEILFMDQLADIVNQPADEEFFHLFLPQMPGELLGSESRADRMFPEFGGTKDIGPLRLKQIDHRTGKNQVTQVHNTDNAERQES